VFRVHESVVRKVGGILAAEPTHPSML
jgi:hypothetical protein